MSIANRNFFICCDNYLTEDKCQQYITLYTDHEEQSYVYNDTNPLPINDDELIACISRDFGVQFKLDNLEIVKRSVGSFMGNHVDNGDSMSFILYLNDNFEGGETVLGNDTVIRPKTGRILVFTNGTLVHRVEKITRGDRFVIAGWFV